MSTDTPQAAQVTPNAAEVNNQAQTPAVNTPAAAPVETPAAQAKPVVPEKYELKLPENTRLSPEFVDKVSLYAKEKQLTNEMAQEILNREAAAVDGYYNQHVQLFEKTVETWKQDAMKDPEIGGDGFTKNVELAHRALEKFSTPAFKDALETTGYGNHPELIRIFARIGKLMAEDRMVVPGAQTGGSKTYEEIFYGKN